jgi:hypothetical protein
MAATGEPAKDITRRDLDVFFKPRPVAVIGATDKAGHVGRTVLWNLISSPFGGTACAPSSVTNITLKGKSLIELLASLVRSICRTARLIWSHETPFRRSAFMSARSFARATAALLASKAESPIKNTGTSPYTPSWREVQASSHWTPVIDVMM